MLNVADAGITYVARISARNKLSFLHFLSLKSDAKQSTPYVFVCICYHTNMVEFFLMLLFGMIRKVASWEADRT